MEEQVLITRKQLLNAAIEATVEDDKLGKIFHHNPMLTLLIPIVVEEVWTQLTKEGE